MTTAEKREEISMMLEVLQHEINFYLKLKAWDKVSDRKRRLKIGKERMVRLLVAA
jgi:hypothetical protein